ncbi:hemolysin [Clostridium novyi]|nr:hemolysin [Clostridium novyi]
MWEQHCKFNGWSENSAEKPKRQKKKYVNIEDLPI